MNILVSALVAMGAILVAAFLFHLLTLLRFGQLSQPSVTVEAFYLPGEDSPQGTLVWTGGMAQIPSPGDNLRLEREGHSFTYLVTGRSYQPNRGEHDLAAVVLFVRDLPDDDERTLVTLSWEATRREK